MDHRNTFKNLQELQAVLLSLHHDKQKASLIIDHEGLTRTEGIITSIEQKNKDDETIFEIDYTKRFSLKQVIAVNGLFRWDYSEC